MKKQRGIKIWMWKCLLCGFVVGFTFPALAQPNAHKIDSLKKLLNSSPDTAGLRIHFFISQLYLRDGVYDSLLVHANAALTKAAKIPSLTHPQKKFRAGAIRLKGIYSRVNGDFESAIQIYIQALNQFEALKDTNGMASTTNSIGVAYLSLKRYNEAYGYFLKSYELDTLLNKPEKISGDLMNMCNALLGNGLMPDSVNEKALVLAQKSNQLALQSKDYVMVIRSTEAIATCLRNLKRLDEALVYQSRALHIADSLNMPEQLAEQQYQMGQIYHDMGQYDKAIYYDLQAEQLALKNGYGEYYYEIYLGLAVAYEKTGSYENAYKYSKKLNDVLDSTYQTQIADQLKKFESDKKDNEIKLLNVNNELKEEEAQWQKQLKNVFIAGAILLLILALVLVNRYQIKQRSAKQLTEKNKIIEKEKQRAEQSEQFKSQFLANMSHEIRTPMNAVMGMTNLLLDEPQNEKNLRYLNVIKHASQNLLVVINDVLDLSKLEAEKMVLEKIPFRITEVISSVYDTLHLKAEEKGLKFITDIDPNIDSVLLGDPMRLTQVLLNLTANAVKFTDKGSVQLSVQRLTPGNEDASLNGENRNHLKISVADTGIGIEKDKLEKIFESFTQSVPSESRIYGGTGLGLTISKDLIELFHGTLEVESEPGAGSVFSFQISLETGTEEQLYQEQLHREGFSGDDLFGLKILLAEDNEHNRLVAVDTLNKNIEEAEIDVAENGKIVLEKIMERSESGTACYDVILMDVQMPEIDGYETTRQIRSRFSPPFSTIPIIALTASVIRSDLKKCIDAGMNSYVAKPFSKETLINEIGKVLQRNTNPDAIRTDDKHNGGADRTHRIKHKNKKEEARNNNEDSPYSIIDLSAIRDLYTDDTSKQEEYFVQFLEVVPVRLKSLRHAFENNDRESVYQSAHKLKPQLGFFGMRREELIANTIEIKAKEIAWEKLHPLIAELEERCILAMKEVRSALQNITGVI